MPRIAIPKREDAPAESKPILDNVDKMLGFVPILISGCETAPMCAEAPRRCHAN
jgi:hypothetical protein